MERVRVAGELTVERAENIAQALESFAERGESVDLDLGPVTFASPGAAARLGNSFRALAENDAKIAVTVPPLDSSESFLSGQMIALQIAAHASSLSEARSQLGTKAVRGRLRDVATRKIPLSISLHALRQSVPVATRLVSSIEELLGTWADEFPKDERSLVSDRVGPLAGAVAEACWNVLDHSHKAPLAADSGVSSTFSCRWLPRSGVRFAPEGFDNSSDRLTDYLGALFDQTSEADRPLGFVELTVSDDGVGVAARQALSEAVYDSDSLDLEVDAFSAALKRGGSVKLRSNDCAVDRTPGFGLTNVADALWRTYGFASLRSGRAVAFFDGLNVEDEADHSFVVEVANRSRLRGTVLHMLVPLFARGERKQTRQPDDLRLL